MDPGLAHVCMWSLRFKREQQHKQQSLTTNMRLSKLEIVRMLEKDKLR